MTRAGPRAFIRHCKRCHRPVRETAARAGFCKRCRRCDAAGVELRDGICGSCGDDLRQEADADRYADG